VSSCLANGLKRKARLHLLRLTRAANQASLAPVTLVTASLASQTPRSSTSVAVTCPIRTRCSCVRLSLMWSQKATSVYRTDTCCNHTRSHLTALSIGLTAPHL